MRKRFYDIEENTVRKGENAVLPAFSPFLILFSRLALKFIIVWQGVKMALFAVVKQKNRF